jgi:hypothetical protein
MTTKLTLDEIATKADAYAEHLRDSDSLRAALRTIASNVRAEVEESRRAPPASEGEAKAVCGCGHTHRRGSDGEDCGCRDSDCDCFDWHAPSPSAECHAYEVEPCSHGCKGPCGQCFAASVRASRAAKGDGEGGGR